LACVFLLRSLDLVAVKKALSQARWSLVALAAGFILLGMWVQALRLRALLWPTKAIPAYRLTYYLLVSNAATNLLPARLGELLRVYLLRAREGIPAATTVAAMLIERILESVALLLLLLPTPWLVPTLPPSVSRGLVWAGLVLSAGLVAALVLSRLRPKDGTATAGRRWLERLRDGALSLNRPRLLLQALGAALLAWVLEGLSITSILFALQIHAPRYAPVVVLLSINAAILLPSTPAQVGAFELGAVAGLRLVGVDEAHAVTVAILCHAVQFFPVTLLGAPGLPGALRARRTG
jgi:uncharacterized membrane protein YbhN (UPF0104 family)